MRNADIVSAFGTVHAQPRSLSARQKYGGNLALLKRAQSRLPKFPLAQFYLFEAKSLYRLDTAIFAAQILGIVEYLLKAPIDLLYFRQ